jgi:hypothetical protein
MMSPELIAALPPHQRCPTLSTGVVIADSHNPVRVLQQVAKELAKSAKRRAHDEERWEKRYTSTLDFLLLKSQSMLRQQVKQLRETSPHFFHEAGAGRGRRMTAAPLTLEEGYRLLRLLKMLHQLDAAPAQLQGLVAALQEGRQYGSIYYLYQQVRLGARLGEARKNENWLAQLSAHWIYEPQDVLPWHRLRNEDGKKDAKQVACILPDLLELYPFVPDTKAIDDLWREILPEASYAS